MTTSPHNFSVPEEDIFAAIANRQGLILVDFDETLYLQNSTEDFIGCAAPGHLAATLLRMLDIVAPWRRTGGIATRDNWRIGLVLLFFPWTLLRWKHRCKNQGKALVNEPLLRALRAKDKPFIVVSIGYSMVIAPLLKAMGCGDIQLIACSVKKRAHRIHGKGPLIEATIGGDALAGALLITDSEDDLAVLARCAQPCLTQWKNAQYRRAFIDLYLPGDYLIYVKRPGKGVLRGFLTEDYALWFLVGMTALPLNLLSMIGITCLFFSLWSVYEIGYMDNDLCAKRFEKDPVFTKEFLAFSLKNFEGKAWAPAIVLGLGGVLAVQPHAYGPALLKWFAVLLGTRGLYWFYNRTDKKTRIWVYLGLQFFKSLCFIVIIPVGIVGILVCCTQIIARWQSYFVYRYMRDFNIFEWPQTYTRTTQFFLFLFFLVTLIFVREEVNLWTWSTAVLIAWSAFLARREVLSIAKEAHRIDKSF